MGAAAILGRVLTHPLTILGSAALGVYTGIAHPQIAALMAPFGGFFLASLQMIALPIIFCAVVSGLGSMLMTRMSIATLRRFALILILGPMLASGLALLIGVLLRPGSHLPTEAEEVFGRLIAAEQVTRGGVPEDTSAMAMFAEQIFTDNIFVSLVDGQSLQVLMFSILLGVALGLGDRDKNQPALAMIEGLFDSLLKIINWLVYLLPLGLFSMLAAQMTEISLSTLMAMLKLVLSYTLIGTLLLLMGNALIAWRTGVGYFRALGAIKEALFVAGGTANAFAALPSALRGLHNNLKLERRTVDLVTPLALNLMPLATIAYFSVAALFIAQISGVALGPGEYVLLFFGAILAGLAAASLPSAAGIAVIAVVLEPLGLPVTVAIILLVAVDPLIEPVNAAVDMHMACTAASLMAEVEA